jgi:hypothetical protein
MEASALCNSTRPGVTSQVPPKGEIMRFPRASQDAYVGQGQQLSASVAIGGQRNDRLAACPGQHLPRSQGKGSWVSRRLPIPSTSGCSPSVWANVEGTVPSW